MFAEPWQKTSDSAGARIPPPPKVHPRLPRRGVRGLPTPTGEKKKKNERRKTKNERNRQQASALPPGAHVTPAPIPAPPQDPLDLGRPGVENPATSCTVEAVGTAGGLRPYPHPMPQKPGRESAPPAPALLLAVSFSCRFWFCQERKRNSFVIGRCPRHKCVCLVPGCQVLPVCMYTSLEVGGLNWVPSCLLRLFRRVRLIARLTASRGSLDVFVELVAKQLLNQNASSPALQPSRTSQAPPRGGTCGTRRGPRS